MYVVAKGHSFVKGFRVFKPGDEITEAAFPSKDVFRNKIKQGKIVGAPDDETLVPAKDTVKKADEKLAADGKDEPAADGKDKPAADGKDKPAADGKDKPAADGKDKPAADGKK